MGGYKGRNSIGTLNYFKAQTMLGHRDEKLICNNTRLVKRNNGIAVRHWNTDIITFYQDGRTLVDTDGYHTVTTMARVNSFLPRFRVWSERGSQVLHDSDTGNDYEYNDGLIIQADGSVPGLLPLLCIRLNTWYKVHKIEKTVETREQVIEAIKTMPLDDLISVWKHLRKDRYLIAEHCRPEFLPVIVTQSGPWSSVVEQRLGHGLEVAA